MRIFAALLIPFLLIHPACMTINWHRSIVEMSSPAAEFTPYDGGNLSFIKGQYLGIQKHEGKDWHAISLPDTLIGQRRRLLLLLPVNGPGDPIITESEEQPTMPAFTAFAIRQQTCCMSSEQFQAVLFIKAGEASDPETILREQFKQAGAFAPDAEKRAVIVLDQANVSSLTLQGALWQKEGGRWIAKATHASVNDYDGKSFRLEWRARSRVGVAFSYALYAVTVPLDIVTSPFQLLGVIGMLIVGPGAK